MALVDRNLLEEMLALSFGRVGQFSYGCGQRARAVSGARLPWCSGAHCTVHQSGNCSAPELHCSAPAEWGMTVVQPLNTSAHTRKIPEVRPAERPQEGL